MPSILDASMSMYECATAYKPTKNRSDNSEYANDDNDDNALGNDQRVGFDCPVCLRNVDDLKTFAIPCGHWCCDDCMQFALVQHQSCPVCNLATNPNSLFRIFLP